MHSLPSSKALPLFLERVPQILLSGGNMAGEIFTSPSNENDCEEVKDLLLRLQQVSREDLG